MVLVLLMLFTPSTMRSVSSPGTPPVADAGPDKYTNEGTIVVFDGSGSYDPDGTIESYEWDFGDPENLTKGYGVTVSHAYGWDGTTVVFLVVTDNDGMTDDDYTYVTMENVAPSVDAGPDQTVSEGETVYFNGSFTDPGWTDTHTIEWNFDDGSYAYDTLTPTHVYTSAGTYTVTLTVTDDDDSGSDTLTVHACIHGDVNGDGTVDASDLSDLNEAYGSEPGDANWNERCDSNWDGKVDALDLFDLSKNYGKSE